MRGDDLVFGPPEPRRLRRRVPPAAPALLAGLVLGVPAASPAPSLAPPRGPQCDLLVARVVDRGSGPRVQAPYESAVDGRVVTVRYRERVRTYVVQCDPDAAAP